MRKKHTEAEQKLVAETYKTADTFKELRSVARRRSKSRSRRRRRPEVDQEKWLLFSLGARGEVRGSYLLLALLMPECQEI